MSLLDDLLAERFNGRWWTPRPDPPTDSDLACARRRRELDEAFRAKERGVA